MKVELHRNGEIQIWLMSEDPLEWEFLDQIMKRASNGATIRVTTTGRADEVVVGVEN